MQGSNPWQMPKQPSFGQWGQPAKNAAYGLAGMAPAMGGGQMPGMAQPSMGGSQPGMFQGGYSQLLEMLKKRRMMQMMMRQRMQQGQRSGMGGGFRPQLAPQGQLGISLGSDQQYPMQPVPPMYA